jgi:acetylornithine deacetylase
MPQPDRSVLQQLSQLVATPSVSSTDPLWDQGNRAVIDLLAGWLSDMGFRTEIQEVAADGVKANLIATLGSGPGGLVLAGHTDTVPFDEGRWQSDPLGLTERDNRLYGLGSTDMKGFFPLAIAAAGAFLDKPLKQPLILLATADEESSMNGARALAAAGRPKARAAIIGEPTSLRPVRMHKGIMMEAVRVTGKAGHSSCDWKSGPFLQSGTGQQRAGGYTRGNGRLDGFSRGAAGTLQQRPFQGGLSHPQPGLYPWR